jgi:hypothetical protein
MTSEETKEPQDEILKIKQRVLKVLEDTKEAIHRAFEEEGYDESYFDILIDLKVKIDDTILRVYEKERAIDILG